MKEELLTISEFLKLTRIGERAMLRMLEAGELQISIDKNNALLIDVSALTPEMLSVMGQAAAHSDSTGLEEEVVASEILAALDEMIDESVSLALKWSTEKSSA